MPSLSNRALLLELNVYMAENNIRRGVMVAAANIQAGDSGGIERVLTLDPSGTSTFIAIDDNSGTVIRCTKPLEAEITTTSGSLTLTIKSLMILTSNITSIEFTNPSIEDAVQLRILQV